MTTTISRSAHTRFESQAERPSKTKQNRTDIWTSLLKQTQVAQSRNRSNAIAHRKVLVCGGSPEDQRTFLTSLTRPPPPQPLRRARNEKDQKEKGTLALSNRYAYGYGHFSLFSAQQGSIGSTLGTDSEEVARLECHCVPEPDATYEPLLRRLLAETIVQLDVQEEKEESEGQEKTKHQPSIQILMSWKEPWKFLRRLKAWLQLLAKATLPPNTSVDEDPVDVLNEHNLSITIVIQHVEAQQDLETEGWSEETFDYVCQVLRTVLLPLHPRSALVYASSIISLQNPGSPLTEIQKVIFQGMDLNLSTLSPRPTSSGNGQGAPVKKEELLPRHNVVDRMNIVIPGAWDSAGKVRLLSETFSPEDVLTAWKLDLGQSVFSIPKVEIPETVETNEPPQRQAEEVFSAEPDSPVSSIPSLPPSPSKIPPSAISMYEQRIVDHNAHKAVPPPTITVTTRDEQEFLAEMKVELDAYASKDAKAKETLLASSPARMPHITSIGESTGALSGLGDVSLNVGGVNYNAEAAIDRLKRGDSSAVSRSSTPRQPRRTDSDREGTPSITTPSSSKTDIPVSDLENYFKSLAKKGSAGSRQGTPSRQ